MQQFIWETRLNTKHNQCSNCERDINLTETENELFSHNTKIIAKGDNC